MKTRICRPFQVILFYALIVLNSAQASDKQPELDSAGWLYDRVASVFAMVDETLTKAGAPVVFCSYINSATGEHFLSREGGACVYKNLREGLSQKDQPVGETELWVKTQSGQTLPIKLLWRPAEYGYWGALKEVLALKFESFAHWWSENIAKDKLEEKSLSFEQSLLGSLSLKLPFEWEKVFGQTSLIQIDRAQEISFVMTPMYKKNGYIHYAIEVKARGQSSESLDMNLETDINVLRLERKFKLKGRILDRQVIEEAQ